MSFVNSPKVQYSPDGKPPERKNWQRTAVRISMLLLLFIGVALNLYAFEAGNIANVVSGTNGFVRGIVLDQQGNPVPNAEITLATTPNLRVLTEADGRFELNNVPTGPQYLIVVYQGVGEGFVVDVTPNEVTEVGSLPHTAKPAEWR